MEELRGAGEEGFTLIELLVVSMRLKSARSSTVMTRVGMALYLRLRHP
jgi:hypothetical protein